MIAIEKNIPMPAPRTTPARYPWRQMQVGDSFLVEGTPSAKLRNRLSVAASHAQRRLSEGHRFAVRVVAPNAVRVWRAS
jgi:hypothetical protein